MAQEATANEQKKFKVPRIPGDIMIYPMIVGLLLNTFCPQVFEVGGLPRRLQHLRCRDLAVRGRRHQL